MEKLVVFRPTMHKSQIAAGPPIQVFVVNQTEHPIETTRLASAARAAAQGSPFSTGLLSIAVVDDAAIHKLNRQFLDHDYPTDVLSFPLVVDPPRIEGEIVVSVDTAQREAVAAGWNWDAELMLYVIHGTLHLAGYLDKTPCAARHDAIRRVASTGVLGNCPLDERRALGRSGDLAGRRVALRWRGGQAVSGAMLLWVAALATLAMALANFGQRSLRNFSRRALEEVCRARGNLDRFGEILRYHEPIALGVELLASVTGGVAVASGLTWAAQRWQLDYAASPSQLLFAALTASLLLVVARTWFPWTAERLFAESFLYATWPIWKAAALCATPLSWCTRLGDAVMHRLLGRIRPPEVDDQELEEELRTIVNEGRRGGTLEDDALGMIEGVMDLGDAVVYQIMTPRTDMHMVQVDMPWDDVIADVINSGHTRTPVYDTSRDDIVGILYSKDLLPELATCDVENRSPLRDLVRKPLFVPETKRVDDLLQMFQQSRTHIALVLDEYGGVAGLVTIEDVLEEIVGEIVDEYDPEHIEELERIDDDTYEALGRAHVDEVNDAMNIELPEDGDFDTIAGFVFTALGRIPLAGETVLWQDKVRVRVLEATRRRIERVRIERLTGVEQETA